jgi:hypothetical protein
MWMPGTSPGTTNFAAKPYFIGCILSQTLRSRALRGVSKDGRDNHPSRLAEGG